RARAVDFIEAFEDTAPVLRRDPGAAISNAHPYLLAGDLRRDVDGRAGRRELGGVVEQIVKRLDELRPVADHRQRSRYVRVYGAVEPEPRHALLDQLAEVELRRLDRHGPRLDVAQLAPVVDDFGQQG